MKITDENQLKEKHKSKNRNAYKIGKLLFNQFYDHSTDIYNPFRIYVYDEKGDYLMGGAGATIEDSYNNLISQLIKYMTEYKNERNDLINKIEKVNEILFPESDEDERF